MKQKIVFATGNEGKMREVRMILDDLGMEILSMKEAGQPGDQGKWQNVWGKCGDQGQSGLGMYRRDRAGR